MQLEPTCAALFEAIVGISDATNQEEIGSDSTKCSTSEASAAAATARNTWRRRQQLYRSLVHNRFREAIEVSLPRTVAMLGPTRFHAWVASFLREGGSRSPYLRDVATEFVAWAEVMGRADQSTVPYLNDLARHEVACFEIPAAENDAVVGSFGVITVEDPVRFRKACRLMRYDFAVHRWPQDEPSVPRPERGVFHVFVYRDREAHTRFLELSPMAGAVTKHLMEGQPLGVSIQRGLAEVGEPGSDETLAELAALLDDLEERDVILATDEGRTDEDASA